MALQAAARIMMVQVFLELCRIIVRQMEKIRLRILKNSVTEKTYEKLLLSFGHNPFRLVKHLPGRGEETDDVKPQAPQGGPGRLRGKAAGRREAYGFIGLQPDGAAGFQPAAKGDVLGKIFCLRAIKFHTHFSHKADGIVFRHFLANRPFPGAFRKRGQQPADFYRFKFHDFSFHRRKKIPVYYVM